MNLHMMLLMLSLPVGQPKEMKLQELPKIEAPLSVDENYKPLKIKTDEKVRVIQTQAMKAYLYQDIKGRWHAVWSEYC